jgi:zinc transporter 1/2/3
MAPATEALQSPCLTGTIATYSWAEGIALMTIFVMFFIELMASRFELFGGHDHGPKAKDHAKDLIKDAEKFGDSNNTLKKGLNQCAT